MLSITTSDNYSSIIIEWLENCNVNGYIIKYGPTDANITIYSSTQTSIVITNLPLLTEYNIRIAAYNEHSIGAYSVPVTVAQSSVTSRVVQARTTGLVSELECVTITDEPVDANSTVFTIDSMDIYMATGTKRNVILSEKGMSRMVECSFSINGVSYTSSFTTLKGQYVCMYV